MKGVQQDRRQSYGKDSADRGAGFRRSFKRRLLLWDKTGFIKEWWENRDKVTLITRPRRFGKTLTMSMLDYFFSLKYAGGGSLFEGLFIWEDESCKAPFRSTS